jgi:hypothetical protein
MVSQGGGAGGNLTRRRLRRRRPTGTAIWILATPISSMTSPF